MKIAPVDIPGGPRRYLSAVATGLLALCGASDAKAQTFDLGQCPPGYGVGSHGGAVPASYERLPDDRGFRYENSPLEQALKRVATNSYFRLEYLNWSMTEPGDQILSEPFIEPSPLINVIPDGRPEDPFQANDRNSGLAFAGVVPILDDISLRQNDGLRGTFGVDTTVGDFEANIWFLSENTDEYNAGAPPTIVSGNPGQPFISIRPGTGAFDQAIPLHLLGLDAVPVITTLLNGAVNPTPGTALVFNDGLSAALQTNVMGTEANWIWDGPSPPTGWRARPLIGGRYIAFNEDFNIIGRAVDGFSVLDPTAPNGGNAILNPGGSARTARVESLTRNDLGGAQIGLRSEYVHKYFQMMVEPKAMLFINRHKAQVSTTNLYSATDGTRTDSSNSKDAVPGLAVSGAVQANVTPHLSLRAGYDLLWVGNVSRATQNVIFNDAGVGNPILSHLSEDLEDLLIHGFTFGMQVDF